MPRVSPLLSLILARTTCGMCTRAAHDGRRVSTRAHTMYTSTIRGPRATLYSARRVPTTVEDSLPLSLYICIYMSLSFSLSIFKIRFRFPQCAPSGMPSRKGASREVCASTAAPNSRRTPRQRKYREIKAQSPIFPLLQW